MKIFLASVTFYLAAILFVILSPIFQEKNPKWDCPKCDDVCRCNGR